MKVRWLRSALSGLRSVRYRVAEDNPRAAAEVADRIEHAVDRLASFPQSGRAGTVAGTREVVVTRLPYVIVYRVTDAEIQVLRLFHQNQERE